MVYYFTSQVTISNWHEESLTQIDEQALLEILQEFTVEHTICLDTETDGLNVTDDSVIMLQLGTLTKQLVIDFRGLSSSLILRLKELLENPNIEIVGHNLKFDYNMLKKYDIYLNNVYDTMIADKVIHNGKYSMLDIMKSKRYSLAGVYKFYFDEQISKDVRNEFASWKSKAFTFKQIMYGAKDVVYPLEIKEIQEYWIDKYDVLKTVKLENKALLSVADIEYNGFHVDVEKWLNISKIYEAKIKETIIRLDKALIEKAPEYEMHAVQLSLFGSVEKSRYTYVNWNSDQQVYKILTDVFDIYPEDKDGKPSSGTPALRLLSEKHQITELLIQFRKEAKIISSFGRKFLEDHLYSDGRLRSNFNQIIDTGRMSSRNPNMQQIPSGSERDSNGILLDDFRGAFTAPKGTMLVTSDYSNQEGRIMADKARDKDYIDFFNNGDGDAHSFVATKMFSAAFNKEFIVTKNNENKEYRQKGKILNFMISFGGSAFTLSKTLKISIEEAEDLISSFYKGFPTLKAMFTENKSFAVNNGYIRTNQITKRIRWIPEYNKYEELCRKDFHSLSKEEISLRAKLRGRIERKGMNTPVQGTAGDMTKLALVLLRNHLLAKGILPTKDAKIKIVNVVHDEIVVEAQTEYADLAAQMLKLSMEDAGKYFVEEIAMSTDPVIKTYWDH